MLSNINRGLMRVVARLEPTEGQALAEYALVLAFVFVACIVALGFLGLAIAGELDVVTAALS